MAHRLPDHTPTSLGDVRAVNAALSAGEKRLIKAIDDMGTPTVTALVSGRKPWRLVKDGPSWKSATFCSLANRGLLRIEYGFAMSAKVSLTADGRALVEFLGRHGVRSER